MLMSFLVQLYHSNFSPSDFLLLRLLYVAVIATKNKNKEERKFSRHEILMIERENEVGGV